MRFAAMASIPVAYFLGALSYVQLLIVSIVSGSTNIAFTAPLLLPRRSHLAESDLVSAEHVRAI